jgi:hypothetical protein
MQAIMSVNIEYARLISPHFRWKRGIWLQRYTRNQAICWLFVMQRQQICQRWR